MINTILQGEMSGHEINISDVMWKSASISVKTLTCNEQNQKSAHEDKRRGLWRAFGVL